MNRQTKDPALTEPKRKAEWVVPAISLIAAADAEFGPASIPDLGIYTS
jgi:hypothetical protein